MRQAAARHARHAIAQWLSRQQRSDRRSSRRRWSRWQGRQVERRRGGLGRRVEVSSRPSPSPTSRSRPLEITKIAVSSRGEPSVGGGGAVRAPRALPTSRRRDDRHQLAQATLGPDPTSCSRPSRTTKITTSPRDEGSLGGGGAVTAPHAPPQSQRRDDRRQLALITSSPCPPSRSRPPKITQIASSSRDEGSVGGGGAVRTRYAPPRGHNGVMIGIRSRRPRRVHVRHLAQEHPRSLRSRARPEMNDE